MPKAMLEDSDALLEIVEPTLRSHELRLRIHGDVDGVRGIVDNGGSRRT